MEGVYSHPTGSMNGLGSCPPLNGMPSEHFFAAQNASFRESKAPQLIVTSWGAAVSVLNVSRNSKLPFANSLFIGDVPDSLPRIQVDVLAYKSNGSVGERTLNTTFVATSSRPNAI